MTGPIDARVVEGESVDSESGPDAIAAVQTRTARAKSLSRHSVHLFLNRPAAELHQAEILAVLDNSRDLREHVTIHDLEHYAPSRRFLVPPSAAKRTSLARSLGEQYTFTHSMIPRTRSATGLDEPNVAQSFEELFLALLSSIYSERAPLDLRIGSAAH